MSMESFPPPERRTVRESSNEENQEKIESLRGPFLAAVQKELRKIVDEGKMTEDEALAKFAEAGSVDVALTEKDARIFAWQGVVSQDELQKIVEER